MEKTLADELQEAALRAVENANLEELSTVVESARSLLPESEARALMGEAARSAVERGQPAELRLLIALGCPMEAADANHGQTLAMAAVCSKSEGAFECLRELANAGCSLEAVDNFGLTLVGASCYEGNWRALELLLERGASSTLAGDGSPALCLAAMNGHAQCVEVLIGNGAEIDCREPHLIGNGTPLMLAAAFGHKEALACLAKAGAHIERRSDKGLTAAMLAAGNNKADCLALLIAAGADMEARSDSGDTPKDFAIKHGAGASLSMIEAFELEKDGSIQGSSTASSNKPRI